MFACALLAFLALPGMVAGVIPALMVASDHTCRGGGAYGFVVLGPAVSLVLLHEEPWLRRQFGEEWTAYSASVHRWLPRLPPWRQSKDS